jgi:hypothetical protein
MVGIRDTSSLASMNRASFERRIQDLNDGKPWSEMDLFEPTQQLGSQGLNRQGRRDSSVGPAQSRKSSAPSMEITRHSEKLSGRRSQRSQL